MAKSAYRKELESEFHKLAAKADRRLAAIEAYSHDYHFKGMKKFAYATAQKDIQKYSEGFETSRFHNRLPENTRVLEAKIADIKKFLESPTSTKTGVRQIYVKRAKSDNQKLREMGYEGKELTWQDIANYYEHEHNKIRDKEYGSASELLILATLKENSSSKRKINDFIKNHKKLDGNARENEIVANMLANGITFKDLYKV